MLEPRRLQSCSSSNLRTTTAFPNQVESGEERLGASYAETVASCAIDEDTKEEANSNGGLVKVIAGTGEGKVYSVLPCVRATGETKESLLWPNSEPKNKSLFSAKSVHLSSGTKSDNLAPVE